MNKEQFQKEMDSVRLSGEQKRKLIHHVQHGPQKKLVNWGYRIVLPSFIVLTIFFVMMTISGESPQITTTGKTIQEDTHERWINETIILFIVNAFLLITAIVLAVRLLYVTKRWQHIPRVIRARQLLSAHKKMVMFHVIAVILSVISFWFWEGIYFFYTEKFISTDFSLLIGVVALLISAILGTAYFVFIHFYATTRIEDTTWKDVLRWQGYSILSTYTILLLFIAPFLLSNPIAWFINLLGIMIMLNMCLLISYLLRNMKGATCPHCNVTYTKKETNKKMRTLYRRQCNHCQKPIYLTNKTRTIYFLPLAVPTVVNGSIDITSFVIEMIGNISFETAFSDNFSFITLVIMSAMYLCYFVYHYLPYVTEFQKNEDKIKPLW